MADEEVKFGLAVSLHSAIDEVRTSIMPFNATFPLKDLREALEYWYSKTKNRITYEYVDLGGYKRYPKSSQMPWSNFANLLRQKSI